MDIVTYFPEQRKEEIIMLKTREAYVSELNDILSGIDDPWILDMICKTAKNVANEDQSQNYKNLLINLIEPINDNKYLEFMYRFAKRTKENWGL